MLAREIHSLQHPFIKHCVKLRTDKGYRLEQKQALVAGYKLVKELLPQTVLVTKKEDESQGILITDSILQKITGQKAPEGIAGLVSLPESADLTGAKKILMLDAVQDPGNLGTLIRTALALGFEGAALLPGCADPFNEKAINASKGAVFRLPLQCIAHPDLLPHTRYVADMAGELCPSLTFPCALVLGNEGHGTSISGLRIAIPMKGAMESLNVAIAGGILMHQMSAF